jgi:uncharacterized protein (TIGR02145 family)
VDWEGNVDGFLGRINETPGAGGGEGMSMYSVTVESIGSDAKGSNNYLPSVTVNINAGTAPPERKFAHWATTSNGVILDNPNNPSTTFIMPANNVKITAVFDTIKYEVRVSSVGTGATGSGYYAAGKTVNIYAGTVPGWVLLGWTGIDKDILSDWKNANCSFTMPNQSVNLNAKFVVTPTPSISTFIDTRDNTTYKKVSINGKMWMAENLNYQTASGSLCYNNDNSNCNKYGRLYDWNTAKTVCPSGWHLPSREEWNVLINEVGGDMYGSRLKATNGWNSNGNGTDDYGFSALPGGRRGTDGSFDGAGNDGSWWTATEYGSFKAYGRGMDYYNDNVIEGYVDKDYVCSVRCVGN